MLRLIMGLSVACLIAGCGDDDAAADKKDDKKDAAATSSATVDHVAVVTVRATNAV